MRIISVVLLTILIPLATFAQDLDDRRKLTVSGEGRVEVSPDMATIRLGVLTEARGAREAIDKNSSSMKGVLERLKGLGIAERDMQTSDFSVQPRWENYRNNNEAPRIVGFVANNILTVRVRDLARLGEVLDEVTRDGANRFDGLSFGLQTPEPSRDEARRRAVKAARDKAALYAEAGDFKLGPLLLMSESGRAPQPRMMARAEMAMMEADAVPIASGELTVTASVTMVYEINSP